MIIIKYLIHYKLMVLNFIIITIMEVIKVILEDSQITSKVKL
jgi:hypothetical protein